MTQIVLPYIILNGTPEDITQVMADLNAIVQIVNGSLDDGNFAAANKDGAAGVASLRTLGAGAQQAAPGQHHTQHQHGGGDEIAVAVPAPNSIPKSGSSSELNAWILNATNVVFGLIKLAADIGGVAGAPQITGLQGVPLPAASAHGFLKRNAAGNGWEAVPWGTTANTVVMGNDSRLQQDAVAVFADAIQAMADGTWTTVTFNQEENDTNALHNPAVNPGRLTAAIAGTYLVSGIVEVAASAINNRGIRIFKNGTYEMGKQLMAAAGSGNHALSVSALVLLGAGDYVELQIFQNSGAARNTVVALPTTAPRFSMVRVAA